MCGCILPSGNRSEFPKLDAELQRRGITPVVTELRGGGRVYQIRDADLARLPRDEKGPYLGDDESGHSLYRVDPQWLEDNRARE